MSESGLRSTIGNRVYATSVSGVRIPISPPVNSMPVGVLDELLCESCCLDGLQDVRDEALERAFSFTTCWMRSRKLTGYGRVAERLNAAVSKTVLPITWVTRVQIPPLPPSNLTRAPYVGSSVVLRTVRSIARHVEEILRL